MITLETEADLRHRVAAWRRDGERIGFVPTMGALHEGHLSLLRRARRLADRSVVSIFVNPSQFGPGEDLDTYPRQIEEDSRMLRQQGCDLLFLPAAETIYPPGFSTWLEVGGPAEGLEGAHRPGHFRGVATVVAILLDLVQPDLAVFGEKDAQQLAVIRRLVQDLRLPVEIVAGPTVRADDGLALSSRNAYLSAEERRAATVLHRALTAARQALADGERRGSQLRRRLRQVLESEPLAAVDYAEVVDAGTFQPLKELAGRVVIPLAVRIGSTRLIDNLHLDLDRLGREKAGSEEAHPEAARAHQPRVSTR